MMKRLFRRRSESGRFHFLTACLMAVLLSPGVAQCADSVQSSQPTLSGWGQVLNPDGDCHFNVKKRSLQISVPGAPNPHDLAAEIDSINAPRVMRPVDGDFILQVQVDGQFEPGEESTQVNRTGYVGAGIVIMIDPSNVITLARATLQHPGQAPAPYANFEIRVNGKLQRIGMTGDHPLPENGPVYLRLEKRHSTVIGSVSTDGVRWDTLGKKKTPEKWSNLQAGVVAISTSTKEFHPRFSQLKVFQLGWEN